jgi:heme-degrading monooxygenase HmoA
MAETYTHTTWRVKPGQEEEFIRRWKEWIDWSHLQGLGPRARLLRDAESPSTFVSFGPWMSPDAVKNWRAAAGYHERVAAMQELLEGFEPRTLDVVAEG